MTSDDVFTFTYLLIMLQTDLYNPNVKNKMKYGEFERLAKNIYKELDEEYL